MLGAAAATEAAREPFEHAVRESRQQAIGQSGDRILLVHDEWPAQQPGRDAARPGREAAGAEHDAGPVLAHGAQGLEQRDGEPERCDEQRRHALATQAADAQPLDRDALRGDQSRLDAALRAEPDDVVAAAAQHARRRERREHVPAGAARHDQGHVARHSRRPSRDTAERPVSCVS